MADAEVQTALGADALDDVRPNRTLWLLSLAHAVNHAQAALLPLVYLAIIPEFHVDAAAIALLVAVGNVSSGLVQFTYAGLTRRVSRRSLLGLGGLIFGGGFAVQALAPSFAGFAAANVVSRIGGSPQHPVGNGLLSEQFPEHRRGFAISAHIAGGNVGTVVVPLLGAWLIAGYGWRWTVVLFGVPAMLIALAIFVLVRESGADRAAARAYGSLRTALRAVARDRNLMLTFISGMLGGGGRGLGVLNVFVPLYLSLVIHLDALTVSLMYTALVVLSVPGPIVAGTLSDRFGRKPLILAAYIGGAGCARCVHCRRLERAAPVDRDPVPGRSSTSSRARSFRHFSRISPRQLCATPLSRPTSPLLLASDRCGWPCTAGSSLRLARTPGCRSHSY